MQYVQFQAIAIGGPASQGKSGYRTHVVLVATHLVATHLVGCRLVAVGPIPRFCWALTLAAMLTMATMLAVAGVSRRTSVTPHCSRLRRPVREPNGCDIELSGHTAGSENVYPDP